MDHSTHSGRGSGKAGTVVLDAPAMRRGSPAVLAEVLRVIRSFAAAVDGACCRLLG